jgi:hypothetical protein
VNDANPPASGGLLMCGGLTYSISGSPSVSISATGLISMITIDKTQIGAHTVTVTVTMTNSPLITGSSNFVLTVKACKLTGISFVPPITLLTYEVFSHLSSHTLPITFLASGIVQNPLCGYSTSIQQTTTPSLSIMTATNVAGVVTINISASSDRSKAGTHTILVSLGINGYPASYTPQPTTTSSIPFTVLDPCRNTVITDTDVEDFAAFAHYNVYSLNIYSYSDQVDLLSPVLDYCGTKTFTLSLPVGSKNQLTGANGGKIKFTPSSDSLSYGTEQASLKI